MISFDGELRKLAGELDLPEPVRSRALLELRADLEGMAAALEARGVAEGEARRRALEALYPSAEAVAELRRVHRPLYQRLVDRYSARGRHRLERGVLVLLGGSYLVGGTAVLSRLDLLASPSPFLWPVLVLSALVVVVGVGKLVQLFVLGVHGLTRLRRGHGLLLGLTAAVVVAAFAGACVDFHGLASALETDATRQMGAVLSWLRRDTALLAVALLAASAGGLLWLGAAVRIARVEEAEAAALRPINERREEP